MPHVSVSSTQIDKAISDLEDIQNLTNMDRIVLSLKSEGGKCYVAEHVLQDAIGLLNKFKLFKLGS